MSNDEWGIPEEERITVKLIGENDNVFNLVGITQREMRRAGQHEKYKEMQDRIVLAGSYEEVLCIIQEYVEVC